jgi:MSHA biogenesis protein MshP
MNRRRQAGIGLATAIFIITLMALIAVAVNLLVSQNAQTFEEQLQLTRAFYAAESGAGFAMNGIYPPEEYSSYGGGTCAGTPASPVSYTLAAPGLNQCSVEVHCTEVDTAGSKFLTIESTGYCGDVERTIRVRTAY